jgi:arylsulfatase A-like enzyme
MTVTMTVVFIAYWVLWFVIVKPAAMIFKRDHTHLDFGLAFFLLNIYVLYIVHRKVDFSLFHTNLKSSNPALASIIIIASLIISILTTTVAIYILHRINHKTWYRHIQRLCLAITLFLACIAVISFLKSKSGTVIGFTGVIAFFISFLLIRKPAFFKTLNWLLAFTIIAGAVIGNFKHPLALPAKPPSKIVNTPKHVIVIVIDTLRADAISCLNPDTRETPNIDALAKDAVLFSNAFSSAPWTVPSVASILTGQSPFVHEVNTAASPLSLSFNTMPEYFYKTDYRTAIISQSIIIKKKNLEQGVEVFRYNRRDPHNHLLQKLLGKLFPTRFFYTEKAEWVTDLAADWFDMNSKQNTFTYLHYIDPHMPSEPSKEFLPDTPVTSRVKNSFSEFSHIRSGHFRPTEMDKKRIRDLHQSETAQVDHNIGRLITHLKKLNIYDDLLIVLTSDHGEEFFEHGSIEHGHTLYNELLKVPLIIKLPKQLYTKKVDSRVSINSIMPTVLDICRIEYDPKSLSAKSLKPLMDTNTSAGDRNIISSQLFYFEQRQSLCFDNFKYIQWLESGKQELYDLAKDPGESINLANEFPEVIKQMKQILATEKAYFQTIKQQYDLPSNKSSEPLDKETIEALKSLGYIK